MVRVTETELEEEFEVFSIPIDGSDVADKLLNFCHLYKLSAEKIVEEWVAFCSTKKQNLKKITIDLLEHLERERLCKKEVKTTSKSSITSQLSQTHMYNANELEQLYETEEADEDPLLNLYSTPDNRNLSKKRHRTPENVTNRQPIIVSRSPATALSKSPCVQGSPSSANLTPSHRYTTRGNAGEVICSYGNPDVGTHKTGERHYPTVAAFDQESSLLVPFKYMFQKTSDKAYVLNDLITDMAQKYIQSGLTEDFAHVALPVQETVTVVGRVCCDSNGKLNASSVLLEGAKDTSAGRQVALDVSNVPVYSLFPGQIIAVNGTNNSGRKLIASKIHEGIFLPSSKLPPNDVKFTMLIAAGPYTTTDNILYEPLNDFITYLQKDTPPDVCVLLGPFIDVKHPLFEKGDIGTTYDDLFTSVILRIVHVATRLKIQLILVPSTRDLHHDLVYPQPPYPSQFLKKIKDLKNEFVHLVSDPCTLNIDGITVGLTSTDVIFHLGAEEISSGQTSDRISRLVHHILTQHTYYPLYPPHADVPIDLEQFDRYCRLPVNPNLLVIPSDLRCFIKDVGETVCINPGKMSKGQVGGSFTRLTVDYKSDQPTEHAKNAFRNCVTAEIIRI